MDSLPWPNIGIGSGWLLVAYFVYLVFTGRVGTGREMDEKNARIRAQAETIREQGHQLTLVLTETMAVLSPVLKALRTAHEAQETEEP